MKVSEFDFHMPLDLIAQTPSRPRDSARLLNVHSSYEDLMVKDLPRILKPKDMLVFNNTKVFPSRVSGTCGTRVFQVTLHKNVVANLWLAFALPGKKLKVGDSIEFSEGLIANVIEKHTDGNILLSFNKNKQDLFDSLEHQGIMPLPPYIKRPNEGWNEDYYNYQTTFASKIGAVAAPTAGLHFTKELMSALTENGIGLSMITLHVGAGTFLPVRTTRTENHEMHAEWGQIEKSTADQINTARENGGRIIPVGSTSLRLLETVADKNGRISEFSGETNIFIAPGYKFKIADKLLTNFHLPKSTLMMLVCAFSGLENIKAAYAHAVEQKYRFFSYGDACLLEKRKN